MKFLKIFASIAIISLLNSSYAYSGTVGELLHISECSRIFVEFSARLSEARDQSAEYYRILDERRSAHNACLERVSQHNREYHERKQILKEFNNNLEDVETKLETYDNTIEIVKKIGVAAHKNSGNSISKKIFEASMNEIALQHKKTLMQLERTTRIISEFGKRDVGKSSSIASTDPMISHSPILKAVPTNPSRSIYESTTEAKTPVDNVYRKYVSSPSYRQNKKLQNVPPSNSSNNGYNQNVNPNSNYYDYRNQYPYYPDYKSYGTCGRKHCASK